MLIYLCYRCLILREKVKGQLAIAEARGTKARGNRKCANNRVQPLYSNQPAPRQPAALTITVPAKASQQNPNIVSPAVNVSPLASGFTGVDQTVLRDAGPPMVLFSPKQPATISASANQTSDSQKQRKPSYDEFELLNYYGGEDSPGVTVNFTQFQQAYTSIKRPQTGDSMASSVASDSRLLSADSKRS
jgi:hypothetical protein